MTRSEELRQLVEAIGVENIWRPICDDEGNMLVSGAGHEDESLPEAPPSHIDFQGKTVVDLGCNVGTFVCRAARLGARRASGVDIDSNLVRCAEILADQEGVDNVDFMVCDFNSPPEEKYDVAMMFDIIGNTTIGNGHMHRFMEIMEKWAGRELIISLKPVCRSNKHFGKSPEEFCELFPTCNMEGERFYPVREAVDFLGARGWELRTELPEDYERCGMKMLLHFVRN
ncbi:class I SAM-dependent methyltransferase [Salidesulfovibrio onnuriiensis]|uniref:class I SAM-dependent methyltransferase n=1 Tax=Salidesulfovibrio onnuriiensis TaxID=2583823 RepID=UPI0011CA2467|nr:class I SAM-dependent methyltransferase [Salidesulfovibrio onnuriiensis]